jgi:hypothetical protein
MYETCKKCFQTYLSTSTGKQCMSCKKDMTEKFIIDNTSATFYKKYHKQLMSRTVEIEKSTLHQTIIHIETSREFARQLALQRERARQPRLQNTPIMPIVHDENVFTVNCPTNDCRGYVNANTHACSICKVAVCTECFEPIHNTNTNGHICNQDTVKNIKMLKKDTKPCPTCKTPIHKIDGCSQIWCVKCHTAFDFYTGVIEKTIHNPHYYQYMRENNMPIPRAEHQEHREEITDFAIHVLALNGISDMKKFSLIRLDGAIDEYIRELQLYIDLHNAFLVCLKIKFIYKLISEKKFVTDVIYAYKINNLCIGYLNVMNETKNTLHELVKDANVFDAEQRINPILENANTKFSLIGKMNDTEIKLCKFDINDWFLPNAQRFRRMFTSRYKIEYQAIFEHDLHDVPEILMIR